MEKGLVVLASRSEGGTLFFDDICLFILKIYEGWGLSWTNITSGYGFSHYNCLVPTYPWLCDLTFFVKYNIFSLSVLLLIQPTGWSCTEVHVYLLSNFAVSSLSLGTILLLLFLVTRHREPYRIHVYFLKGQFYLISHANFYSVSLRVKIDLKVKIMQLPKWVKIDLKVKFVQLPKCGLVMVLIQFFGLEDFQKTF